MRRSNAYELGLDAGRRSLWFYRTLGHCLAQGLIKPEERLEFYKGYWGDRFDVVVEGGRIRMMNKDFRNKRKGYVN